MLALEVISGGASRTVQVRDRIAIVGSAPAIEQAEEGVRLTDSGIAHRHARLLAREGQWCVEDLASRHGTYVNGRRIRGPQPLTQGDRIALGESVLMVRELHKPKPAADHTRDQDQHQNHDQAHDEPPALHPGPDARTASPRDQTEPARPTANAWIHLQAQWPERPAEPASPMRSRELKLHGLTELGRQRPCVRLPDSRVSRRHCRLWPDHAGWWVEDLGSRHGTFVNGRRLKKPGLIDVGDELAIGRVRIQVVNAVTAPAEPAPTAADIATPVTAEPATPHAEPRKQSANPLPPPEPESAAMPGPAATPAEWPDEGDTRTAPAARVPMHTPEPAPEHDDQAERESDHAAAPTGEPAREGAQPPEYERSEPLEAPPAAAAESAVTEERSLDGEPEADPEAHEPEAHDPETHGPAEHEPAERAPEEHAPEDSSRDESENETGTGRDKWHAASHQPDKPDKPDNHDADARDMPEAPTTDTDEGAITSVPTSGPRVTLAAPPSAGDAEQTPAAEDRDTAATPSPSGRAESEPEAEPETASQPTPEPESEPDFEPESEAELEPEREPAGQWDEPAVRANGAPPAPRARDDHDHYAKHDKHEESVAPDRPAPADTETNAAPALEADTDLQAETDPHTAPHADGEADMPTHPAPAEAAEDASVPAKADTPPTDPEPKPEPEPEPEPEREPEPELETQKKPELEAEPSPPASVSPTASTSPPASAFPPAEGRSSRARHTLSRIALDWRGDRTAPAAGNGLTATDGKAETAAPRTGQPSPDESQNESQGDGGEDGNDDREPTALDTAGADAGPGAGTGAGQAAAAPRASNGAGHDPVLHHIDLIFPHLRGQGAPEDDSHSRR